MPISAVKFKDPDGFHYKHPERTCNKCKKYPCVPNMDSLKGNFAAYGCTQFEDVDTFEVCKVRK